MPERWRDVPGYEGLFQVSDRGRVKSLPRLRRTKGDGVCPVKEKFLTPYLNGDYWKVYLKKEGKGWLVGLHRLVLLAFRGPPKRGQQGRHLDGDASNNFLFNLEWGTAKENGQDKIRHGTNPSGERNIKAKLTWRKVRQIRKMYQTTDISQQELADMFGVHQTAISNIVRNKGWIES